MDSYNTQKRCFLCRTEVEISNSEGNKNVCSFCPPSSAAIYYCSSEHLSVHRGKCHQNRNRISNAISGRVANTQEANKNLEPKTASSEAYNGPEIDTICWPFCIETRPLIGRIMVATRDIRAGETILEEPPAVWGPNSKSTAVCLECLSSPPKILESECNNKQDEADDIRATNKCSKCQFPVCGNKCK